MIDSYKNKEELKVSVVIPVYNAARYVAEAVESAIYLKEVGEVILVEDGSPDNALEICKSLEIKFPKVRVFQHPGGVNKGAGASRNLGVKEASCAYISFLDADDIYLPNRFKAESSIFCDDKIDGVYNTTGKYENKNDLGLTFFNLKKNVNPEDVLYKMLTGEVIFDTNGITLKKEIIEKAEYFNNLELHEDTHLWYKIAHLGNLKPGNLEEAVALTRNHNERRIFTRSKGSKIEFLEAVIHTFSAYKKIDKRFIRAIVNKYCWNKASYKLEIPWVMMKLFLKYPYLVKYYL